MDDPSAEARFWKERMRELRAKVAHLRVGRRILMHLLLAHARTGELPPPHAVDEAADPEPGSRRGALRAIGRLTVLPGGKQ